MNKLVLLTGVLVLVAVMVVSFSVSAKTEICDSFLRLHILANSDSDYDQDIKIKVRDYVIRESDCLINTKTKTQMVFEMEDKLNLLNDKINNYLCELGADYKGKAYIGEADFPTKSYGNVALPAGRYDSVIVELGEAKGKNWWCVLYPSLCFLDSTSPSFDKTSINKLTETIGDELTKVLIADNGNLKIKFKLLELVKSLT